MSKNFTRCLIAITFLASSASPALCQSKEQVDKINKWFDQNKENQKKAKWQTPGQLQKSGTMQNAGTIQKAGDLQIPTGWKAIKTSDLPCQKRFAISGDTLFEFDRDTLTPHAVATLNLLVPELKKQVTHPVTIEGHTDSVGTDEYNMTLSARRAARVKTWLADNKIFDATNIKVVGHGKRIPVAPNTNSDGTDNPEGRRLNRRVEIVVNTCVTLDKPATETAAGTPEVKPTVEAANPAIPENKADATATPVATETTNDASVATEKKDDTTTPSPTTGNP